MVNETLADDHNQGLNSTPNNNVVNSIASNNLNHQAAASSNSNYANIV